ncbi:MAG: amino-acid N-acetyltransferase [Pseudomonadales bacterium]|nr:amino-acid N-acetyltransferase [Pseudomonadales bacterium]
MSTADQFVSWFRQSSPYIHSHRGKTFVLMIPGDGVAHPNFSNIIHDIALLNSLGVRLVLVHGMRPQIEAELSARGIKPQFHGNVRITTDDALPCVIRAAGQLRIAIEAELSMGLANSPMHGARIRVSSGNFVVAKPIGVHEGVDFCHTGAVRRVDIDTIQRQLDCGDIVLLSPLGYSPSGEVFNLLMEELASTVATRLHAEKIIALGDKKGALDTDGSLIRELTTQHRMTPQEAAKQSLLKACLSACNAGVRRGHLISYQEDGALLQELFTRDGAGTLINQGDYDQVRSATIDDIGGILEIIQPLEEDGTLVRRSRELLETELDKFTLIERDGMITACAALYPYADQPIAEVACVAVHREYRKSQRGELLLSHLEKQARVQGIEKLFVLTTRTAHWFKEKGFKSASLEDLPEQKKSLYNYQRSAQVFIKDLASK